MGRSDASAALGAFFQTAALLAATAVCITLSILISAPAALGSELRGSQPSVAPFKPTTRGHAGYEMPGLRGSVLGFRKHRLTAADRAAALAAVQTTLNEVGDGNTYVWYRRNSPLTGLMRPVKSFADEKGRICRVLRITLMAGPVTKTVQGNACRNTAGRWSLERS